MRAALLALLVTVSLSVGPTEVPELCMGAQLAILHATALKLSQERSTPEGEWCQRAEPQMPAKAHACDCHKHDCEDHDPSHVSAHLDPQCLNYCNTKSCACKHTDCEVPL